MIGNLLLETKTEDYLTSGEGSDDAERRIGNLGVRAREIVPAAAAAEVEDDDCSRPMNSSRRLFEGVIETVLVA